MHGLFPGSMLQGRHSPLGAGMAYFPATAQGAPLPNPLQGFSAGNSLFTGTLLFTPLNAGLEVFVRRQRRAFKSQQEDHVERNTVEVILKKTR